MDNIIYEDDQYLCFQLNPDRRDFYKTYYKFASLSVKQIVDKANLPNKPKLFKKVAYKVNTIIVLFGFIFSIRRIYLIVSKNKMLPIAAFSVGAGGDIGNLYIHNSKRFYKLVFFSTCSLKNTIFKASENIIDEKIFAVVRVDSPINRYLSQLGFTQASKKTTVNFLWRTQPLIFSPFRVFIWKIMDRSFQTLYLYRDTLK